MDSISLPPSSPACATPLCPVSPERTNRRALQSPLCISPRIRDDPFFSSPHRNSDVQGKVSQFNQLSENNSPKRKDADAALRRAMLGREEAEAKTRDLEEENYLLRESVEQGRARELKIAQRVEAMMEDVQRHKESGARAQTVYEKEIRRARKEAFKSSSALVKLQEELKTTRNRYTLMREEVDVQKRKVETKEQETFAAQYKLVSVEEELGSLQQVLKVVEQERDALRTSLKEEEVARIAAEGRIPLPPSSEDDEFSTPRKTPRYSLPLPCSNGETNDETLKCSRDSQIESLEQEITIERRFRREAQEMVTFMKLECQLWRCSCRRAEQEGNNYIHDRDLSCMMSPRTEPRKIMGDGHFQERTGTPDESVIIRPSAKVTSPVGVVSASNSTPENAASENIILTPQVVKNENEAQIVDASLVSPLLVAPVLAPPLAPVAMSESPSILSLPSKTDTEFQVILASTVATNGSQQASKPNPRSTPPEFSLAREEADSSVPDSQTKLTNGSRPTQVSTAGVRLVANTITTKVPLSDRGNMPSGATTPKFPFSPGATKTREEALQSIQRWREGRARARSVTTGSSGAPSLKKANRTGSPIRRDISAPERRGL